MNRSFLRIDSNGGPCEHDSESWKLDTHSGFGGKPVCSLSVWKTTQRRFYWVIYYHCLTNCTYQSPYWRRDSCPTRHESYMEFISSLPTKVQILKRKLIACLLYLWALSKMVYKMNEKYGGSVCLFDSRNSSSVFGESWFSDVHQKLLKECILILVRLSISHTLHETHTDLIKFS
jgi:hypothetical protein